VKGEALNDVTGFQGNHGPESPHACCDFGPIKNSRIGELAAKFDIVMGMTPEA